MSGIKEEATLGQDMENIIQQLKALNIGDTDVEKAAFFKELAEQVGLRLLINAFKELQQQNQKHLAEKSEIKGEIRIKIVRTSDSANGLTGTLDAFCFPCPIRSDKKICIGFAE